MMLSISLKKNGPLGNSPIQIAGAARLVTRHQIEYGYTKMIMSAKKSVYLQSPYFIPDNSYINAIKIAAKSGVHVHLMIPCKPDHPLVYCDIFKCLSTYYQVALAIYTYENGFIHSKNVLN